MRIIRSLFYSFSELFNLREEKAKGRLIGLLADALTAVQSIFLSGVFFTGFLTMYGMSISDTGILTVIPYIANLFSFFSPKLLGRFRRRKGLLLWSKLIYHFVNIVLITLMPQFVVDSESRLVWFIVLTVLATGYFALFGPGFTMWFYNFYPDDTTKRARYLSFSQISSYILISIITFGSSLLTDALSNSPYQNTLILIFRYGSFALVVLEVLLRSLAKEYPYAESEKIRLLDTFTIPFRHKKFMACMILSFAWLLGTTLYSGVWQYHLLNNLGYSYTLINSMSLVYTAMLLLLSPLWRKLVDRYSWVKTFGIASLLAAPVELVLIFLNKDMAVIYVITAVFQQGISVGANLVWANLLYLNLPKKNSTACISFYVIGSNIFTFLSMSIGTWISSLNNSNPIDLFGLSFYPVQFTPLPRALFMILCGLFLIVKWRSFTNDEEIANLAERTALRKQAFSTRKQ